MAMLLLAQLKPGMCLARGVLSTQGVLLANPGDRLTEKQIRLFKMWGVVEAEVVGEAAETDREPDAETAPLGPPEEEIDRLFAPHLNDHVMFRIASFAKQLVAQRKA